MHAYAIFCPTDSAILKADADEIPLPFGVIGFTPAVGLIGVARWPGNPLGSNGWQTGVMPCSSGWEAEHSHARLLESVNTSLYVIQRDRVVPKPSFLDSFHPLELDTSPKNPLNGFIQRMWPDPSEESWVSLIEKNWITNRLFELVENENKRGRFRRYFNRDQGVFLGECPSPFWCGIFA